MLLTHKRARAPDDGRGFCKQTGKFLSSAGNINTSKSGWYSCSKAVRHCAQATASPTKNTKDGGDKCARNAVNKDAHPAGCCATAPPKACNARSPKAAHCGSPVNHDNSGNACAAMPLPLGVALSSAGLGRRINDSPSAAVKKNPPICRVFKICLQFPRLDNAQNLMSPPKNPPAIIPMPHPAKKRNHPKIPCRHGCRLATPPTNARQPSFRGQ